MIRLDLAVADPAGARGPWLPGPVKIGHKKDDCPRRSHRFHVSRPPYPAAGSATDLVLYLVDKANSRCSIVNLLLAISLYNGNILLIFLFISY